MSDEKEKCRICREELQGEEFDYCLDCYLEHIDEWGEESGDEE